MFKRAIQTTIINKSGERGGASIICWSPQMQIREQLWSEQVLLASQLNIRPYFMEGQSLDAISQKLVVNTKIMIAQADISVISK